MAQNINEIAMDILAIFKLLPKGIKLYSPLYGELTFTETRRFNPLQTNTPEIIECKTMANSVVLFNNEGKPIIFHPTGDMIFETNLGECMIYPSSEVRDWQMFIEELKNIITKHAN